MVAQKSTQTKGEIGPQLPAFQQGNAWVFIESGFIVIHCTLCRERGKGKQELKPKESPASNGCAASCAKGVWCSDKMQRIYEMSERNSKCEVKRSGRSRRLMARENEGKLKRGVTSLG